MNRRYMAYAGLFGRRSVVLPPGRPSRIEGLQGSIEKGLSSTIDTDVAKTTIEYANQQAAYEAALRAGANIVQESLLNFLH